MLKELEWEPLQERRQNQRLVYLYKILNSKVAVPPDEMDLIFYEKYSFINCRLECAILRVEPLIGCVPWHLPKVIDIYLNISLLKILLLLVEKRLKNL